MLQDVNVKELWDQAADMLKFVEDANLVTRVDEILAPIISDMLIQIFHCASFVREYGRVGFLGQFLVKFLL